jgi:hypothetical protein
MAYAYVEIDHVKAWVDGLEPAKVSYDADGIGQNSFGADLRYGETFHLQVTLRMGVHSDGLVADPQAFDLDQYGICAPLKWYQLCLPPPLEGAYAYFEPVFGASEPLSYRFTYSGNVPPPYLLAASDGVARDFTYAGSYEIDTTPLGPYGTVSPAFWLLFLADSHSATQAPASQVPEPASAMLLLLGLAALAIKGR